VKRARSLVPLLGAITGGVLGVGVTYGLAVNGYG
jgi:hypothetical protein